MERPISICDPRQYEHPKVVDADPLTLIAAQVVSAPADGESESRMGQLVAEIRARLDGGRVHSVERALEYSPTVSVHRTLWRACQKALAYRGDDRIVAFPFAIPVVLVTGGDAGAAIDGLLPDPGRLATAMNPGKSRPGTESLALAGVLLAASRLSLAHMPAWMPSGDIAGLRGRLADGVLRSPDPVEVRPGLEQAHLRFLPGTLIARADVAPFAGANTSVGIEFTRELSRQLAVAGASVLALAGAATDPWRALREGLVAQRDVALQLFLSSALRSLRARAGEPSVVVSAHRIGERDGELRVSVSSRVADLPVEVSRVPLFGFERADEVLGLLRDLLRDCRVTDLTLLADAFPDLDPETGRTLAFSANTLERARGLALQ